jgi:hypothetical protein
LKWSLELFQEGMARVDASKPTRSEALYLHSLLQATLENAEVYILTYAPLERAINNMLTGEKEKKDDSGGENSSRGNQG